MKTNLATAIQTHPAPSLAAGTLLPHVGGTPLIRLTRLTSGLPPSVEVHVKAEWTNPSGSVKDRPAAAILRYAVESGALAGGKRLLDSSSGNMGIAYAALGASLGVQVHLMVPANASAERLLLLRALGAEVTLTDPLEGTEGARQEAAALAERAPHLYYFADQYSHPANWRSHYTSTGPEILTQTQGRVTHFVAGLGTTGTMMGVGRYLREALPRVTLVAVQPDQPLHGLEGLKHLASTPHPAIFDPALPDLTTEVRTEDAHAMAQRLAREEGLLAGFSAAAAVWAALGVARQIESGLVVALLPDSAAKYLSDPVWRGP